MAGVGDRDTHEIGRRVVLAFALHVFDADPDDSPVGHGVARIEAQIENRKLHFAGVDDDRPDVIRDMHLYLDVSAQRAVQHRTHPFQVGRHVDRFRIDRAAPREGQQMPRQPGASGDSAVHRFEHARIRRLAGGELEQLKAAAEDREQVVEIVRDAARQLPQRFHLLRLAQRSLCVAQAILIAQTIGDVIHELIGADTISVSDRAAR